MKITLHRACFLIGLALAFSMPGWGQGADAASSAPLLTLEEAVSIAGGRNREIRISQLNVARAQNAVAQAKTFYLPRLQTYLLVGAPLQPINFPVPAGTFGVYPGIGAIPATESSIHTPQRLSAFVYGAATQPLTQLYKVGLAVKQARLETQLAQESVRAQRQATRQQVKTEYYRVVQLQGQVASAQAAVQAMEGLSAVTERRLAQKTVLAADALTVKAKLHQARYQLLTLQDAFEVQKQSLNRLLARDLRTPFAVEATPLPDTTEWDLEAARRQALEQRPELRQARLQTKIAQMDVRRARAEYIPDISLQVSYLSFQNLEFLPENAGNAGFLFQWQPLDWGFKKHRVAELNSVSQQKALTEQDAEQQVLLDVEDKFRKLRQARALLEAQTDLLDAERERFREVAQRYEQKAALLSDLLQQQAVVADADAQAQRALDGFWTARADFEKAIGAE